MPTRPGFVPDPNREHKALVVMNPAGGKTFGVECTANDWSSPAVFATMEEARTCPALLEHLEGVAARSSAE